MAVDTNVGREEADHHDSCRQQVDHCHPASFAYSILVHRGQEMSAPPCSCAIRSKTSVRETFSRIVDIPTALATNLLTKIDFSPHSPLVYRLVLRKCWFLSIDQDSQRGRFPAVGGRSVEPLKKSPGRKARNLSTLATRRSGRIGKQPPKCHDPPIFDHGERWRHAGERGP